ncbi:myrosinase 1-like [Leptidea sinapis]|uniref:myrosinase 1-like n=1 Tax=Leptidea sinapis TaxID=189913 RepID=UPI002133D29F|nr:myrosinase 1-like [Leptidea sinapis]
MFLYNFLLFWLVSTSSIQNSTSTSYTFPKNFKFGASTSAYQTEGAWDVDGKGETEWDFIIHNFSNIIKDNATADVASDSYNLWEKDVQIAKEMGLNFYRFSISWSRILPTGFANEINNKGVQFYDNLINALLAAGIEPVVTLHHLDLPQNLQILGGWTNPYIVDWFLDYAKLIFSFYADRVKYWLTMNEPYIFCDVFYKVYNSPPIGTDSIVAPFICSKNAMVAHALAYRYYQRVFKAKYNGLISYSKAFIWVEAADPTNVREKEIAELVLQYYNGRFLYPIHSKRGGWPASVEKFIHDISLARGLNRSALPPFTKAEKKLIKGSADYVALNYYQGLKLKLTSSNSSQLLTPFNYAKLYVVGESDLEGAYSTPWLNHNVYPLGMRKAASWINQQYGKWDILITENGYGGIDKTLTDNTRIQAMRDNLEQILLSIHEDHNNIIGYGYWSMIDVFAFANGYNVSFGLWDVDFNDPERPRTARDSARYFTCITQNRQLEPCDDLVKG